MLNISLLWFTGRLVERRVGGVLVLSIYIATVISGGLLIVWWKSFHLTLGVTVGASAGVFGLLSASLLLLYRPAAAGFGQGFQIRVILWLILGIGPAVSCLPGVSFIGHVGGLVTGAILGFILPVLKKGKDQSRDDLQ